MSAETEDKIEVLIEGAQETSEVRTEKTPEAKAEEAGKTPPKTEENPPPETKKEEDPEYSAKVAGRIGNLTRKFREAERRENEALSVAQRLKAENDALRKRALETDQSYVGEAEKKADLMMDQAKRMLAQGHTAGDSNAIADATAALAEAAAEKSRIAGQKAQIRPERYQAPTQERTQQAGPSDKAVAWAENNPWFSKDKAMTAAAYGIHEDIVNSGVHPESDEYYESLDARMKEYFPTKFQVEMRKNITGTPPRHVDPAASVVAPVTRGTPGGPRQIRLTPTQAAVAKRLGVSLEQYAREYAKLGAEGTN